MAVSVLVGGVGSGEGGVRSTRGAAWLSPFWSGVWGLGRVGSGPLEAPHGCLRSGRGCGVWGGWSQVHSHVYDYPSNLAVSSCSHDE
jgi:hypothetical protein